MPIAWGNFLAGHEHRTMLLSAHAANSCADSLTSARHHPLLQPPCAFSRSRPFIRPLHRNFQSNPRSWRPCRPPAAIYVAQPHLCRQHKADERRGSHVLRAARSDAYRQPDEGAGRAQRGAKEQAVSAWASLVSRLRAARLAATPQTSAFTNPKFMPMVLLCVPPCNCCCFCKLMAMETAVTLQW